ncbi:hypothetical protein EJ571_23190 [Mycobacteroides franklinii]|uniref:Lipoprotein n=3 Tax=Mycobacteroides franklinii TaxID=948102 RepID=A0A4R5P7T0_9MYCO|nr:hypothetical protein [Mycobacteroides franklinii]ORA63530.1 hypothetical protein BST24_03990 [Mycobacteroides franklinii]TDH19448.1 hypothetical protein EJ571_23190 [Mycobacteroides franklinii]
MFQRMLMAIAVLLCLTGVSACRTGADSLAQCRNVFSQMDAKNCQLTSADSVGLRFEKWVVGTSAQIRIFTRSGIMVQTVSSKIEGSAESGVMLLRDLDGDGRDELLLSLDTGGAHPNSQWALWRTTGDSTQFRAVRTGMPDDIMHREGALFGSSFWQVGDGLVAEYGTGPTRSWLTRIYTFEGSQLVPIVSVQNDGFRLDGSMSRCRLEKVYDLARIGLTADEARDRFCAATEERQRR